MARTTRSSKGKSAKRKASASPPRKSSPKRSKPAAAPRPKTAKRKAKSPSPERKSSGVRAARVSAARPARRPTTAGAGSPLRPSVLLRVSTRELSGNDKRLLAHIATRITDAATPAERRQVRNDLIDAELMRRQKNDHPKPKREPNAYSNYLKAHSDEILSTIEARDRPATGKWKSHDKFKAFQREAASRYRSNVLKLPEGAGRLTALRPQRATRVNRANVRKDAFIRVSKAKPAAAPPSSGAV